MRTPKWETEPTEDDVVEARPAVRGPRPPWLGLGVAMAIVLTAGTVAVAQTGGIPKAVLDVVAPATKGSARQKKPAPAPTKKPEPPVAVAKPTPDPAATPQPKPTPDPAAKPPPKPVSKPPVDKTPYPAKSPAPAAPFTANQKFGSSGADPPFDVFWGTATPGTYVGVWSAYGAGKTQAAAGRWELRVDFPSAPYGKPFDVKVNAGDGGWKLFTFTRLGAGPDPAPKPTPDPTLKPSGEPVAKP